MVLNGVGEVANGEATDSSWSNDDHMFVGSKTKELLNNDKISSATVSEGLAKRPPYSRRRVVSSGDQPENSGKGPNLKNSSLSSIPKASRGPPAKPSAKAENTMSPPQHSSPSHGRTSSDCSPMSRPIKHRQVQWKGQSIDASENRSAEPAEDGARRSMSIPGALPTCLREDQFDPSEEDRLIAGHRADTGPQPGVLPPSQPTDQSQARQVHGSSNKVTLGSKLDSSDTVDRRSPEPFQTLCNDERPTVIRDPEMDTSEASDFSSSESLHTPPLVRFQNYHQEAISARVVAHEIFPLMKNKSKGKVDLDVGRIYTLRMADHPGFIKIGRTTQAIMKRRNQIQRCVEFELFSANDNDHCPVSNHRRVETLIHAELRNYRRCFPCVVCKQKSKLEGRKEETQPRKNGHECDGLNMHGEWFEIDQAKALKVVERWKEWISKDPYCGGALKPIWQWRIDYYASNARRMERMETVDGEDWRWDEFMAFTELEYWCSCTWHGFIRERLEASSCSRFDSLCKHWKSNVLFCLVVFLLPCLFFVGAEIFPSVFPSGLPLALCYSVVVSVMAVLYAA